MGVEFYYSWFDAAVYRLFKVPTDSYTTGTPLIPISWQTYKGNLTWQQSNVRSSVPCLINKSLRGFPAKIQTVWLFKRVENKQYAAWRIAGFQ